MWLPFVRKVAEALPREISTPILTKSPELDDIILQDRHERNIFLQSIHGSVEYL